MNDIQFLIDTFWRPIPENCPTFEQLTASQNESWCLVDLVFYTGPGIAFSLSLVVYLFFLIWVLQRYKWATSILWVLLAIFIASGYAGLNEKAYIDGLISSS
ncbi:MULTISPECIES: hypothetical protein [Vibrio]|uniref:hypothetical protein n=1 Tax=Vibrio TaxID=662 RepID=UPI00078B46E5|nr:MULTISPECIES: hypothetical protein [Vibrio]BAU71073.1 hypothetical protein [Vibrio sp. 04Ya108]BBM67666.1 hypothetical protein VA249_43120 [Vibrio alfacsensis]BCN27163.1 hypothetical protein VYA_43550 [Vibrio alfacsensis]